MKRAALILLWLLGACVVLAADPCSESPDGQLNCSRFVAASVNGAEDGTNGLTLSPNEDGDISLPPAVSGDDMWFGDANSDATERFCFRDTGGNLPLCFDNDDGVVFSAVGIGKAPADASRLDVASTETATSGTTNYGNLFVSTIAPTSKPDASAAWTGARFEANTAADATDYSASNVMIYGLSAVATHAGSGTIAQTRGMYVESATSSSGTSSIAIPMRVVTSASGSASIPLGYGVYASTSNSGSGTITNATGYMSAPPSNSGGGTFTKYVGFRQTAATAATTIYGFQGELASAANRWNVYMDGTADNYFAGNVGIGTATPGAKLDVTGEVRFSGISGDGTGKVVCIKADGNLGTCSSVVSSSGTCTCGD